MLCHPQNASESLNHNAVNSCLDVSSQNDKNTFLNDKNPQALPILDDFGISLELVPLPSQSDCSAYLIIIARNGFTISQCVRFCILHIPIINTREISTEPDRTRTRNLDSTTLHETISMISHSEHGSDPSVLRTFCESLKVRRWESLKAMIIHSDLSLSCRRPGSKSNQILKTCANPYSNHIKLHWFFFFESSKELARLGVLGATLLKITYDKIVSWTRGNGRFKRFNMI